MMSRMKLATFSGWVVELMRSICLDPADRTSPSPPFRLLLDGLGAGEHGPDVDPDGQSLLLVVERLDHRREVPHRAAVVDQGHPVAVRFEAPGPLGAFEVT